MHRNFERKERLKCVAMQQYRAGEEYKKWFKVAKRIKIKVKFKHMDHDKECNLDFSKYLIKTQKINW